jgi:predicted Zn-dependent protease
MTGVARQPALGRMTAGGSEAQAIPYLGSGTASGTPVLPDDENAKLPSPYDRMDALRKFDEACGLHALGQATAALAAFDELLRDDPGNLQLAFWRARALEALHREADAAAAYRHAFDIGLRSPMNSAKALQCSLKALHADGADPAEWDRAIAFLADARAKGARDDAATWLFECYLYLEKGHVDRAKAAEALRRAEAAPGADAVRAGIEQAKALLESP